MGVLDLVSAPGQTVAYMFPEVVTIGGTSKVQTEGAKGARQVIDDVFVFQFWPQQVSDRYQVNYATKQIPGASHPLYQWTGGGGRTVSFDATFVSEIAESAATLNSPFNERIQRQAAAGPLTVTGEGGASAAFLPSSRYTVRVAAALAAIRRYLYGTYNPVTSKKGITEPPKKLVLVLPGTQLGRKKDNDGILCILLRADVTMESFFPSGEIRSATVSLEFAEIIQHTSGEGSLIKYIGAEDYVPKTPGDSYTISGRGFSEITL